MANSFLDITGLGILWGRITTKVSKHGEEIPTNDKFGHIKSILYHSESSTGITPSTDAISIAVNNRTNTSGRFYGIETDSDGFAFVNVPWTDTNTTYAAAKFNTLGLIKPSKTYTTSAKLTTNASSSSETPTISPISTTSNRYYAVESDVNGVPFVNVPWIGGENFYPTSLIWNQGTDSGPIGVLRGEGMSNVTFPAIPSASNTQSGIVTTGAQYFGGNKTLTAILNDGSTAVTQAIGDDSTKIATTKFVKNAIGSLEGALLYKGVVNANSDIPANHTKGWTYIVNTAGEYAGQQCEVGDMLICLISGTTTNNAHWNIVQTNINGAITGPASSTDGQIAIFNGTSGKSLKAINSADLTVGKANSTVGTLTFTGSISESFNGSENKTINIPEQIVYDSIQNTEIDSIF